MITLYQFDRAFGIPNASPFCLKAETWLRMTGLEHQVEVMADSRKAPKQKLPMIDDNGTRVVDSGFIVEHLKQAHGVDPDAHMSAAERAHALALIRLMEEHLYWCTVYERWIDPTNWPKLKSTYFDDMPFPLKQIVPGVALRMVRKQMHGHGMGRHTAAEVAELAAADLQAMADSLGEGEWFGGAEPATVDAVAYSFLTVLVIPPLPGPVQEAAKSHANLAAYRERMEQRVWADWTA